MPLEAIKSASAKMFLNKQFGDLGEVINVDIDQKAREAILTIILKGETEKTRLDVCYALEKDAFVLERFRCEREWIEAALNRYVAGKRMDIRNSLTQTILKFIL